MTQSNVELAQHGYEAIMRGDVEAVRELLDPDVKWHAGDPSTGCQNRSEAIAFMRQARTRGQLIELLDAGDKVVVILRRTAEDGESTELVANVTTFRNGKVVEMVHYPDPDDARRAAGVLPTP
ncbi:MAG: nuclear transport factor 2 family protein [Solirubrobacterales bacterium]|nr:nuclear transport factor 2 family protein [Solirubrobacterales bacterium]